MPFKDFTDIVAIKKAYYDKLQELEKKDDEKIDLATNTATTEKVYSIARGQATAALRIDGIPTTLIKDLVNEKTATKKFDHEIAKAVLKAHDSSLKVMYSKVDYLRSLLSSAKREMDIR
ncbi:MAG: hypothetical protein GY705_13635 [Bacteroidetes bacterium]|nr:hypothetical protein [Bacteroidota bacterium]